MIFLRTKLYSEQEKAILRMKVLELIQYLTVKNLESKDDRYLLLVQDLCELKGELTK